MKDTLKNLLKPPFIKRWNFIEINHLVTLNIRSQLCDSKLDDTIIDFIIAALNEKWERDFSEPLRWIDSGSWEYGVRLTCPKCKKEQLPVENDYAEFYYCPHCGRKLAEP